MTPTNNTLIDGVTATLQAQYGGHTGRIGLREVLLAYRRIDRKAFLPPAFHGQAYEDVALDLGGGAHAFRPTDVIENLASLGLYEGARVLEIGPGRGYVTVGLDALVGETGQVTSMEIDDRKAQQLTRRLKEYLGRPTLGPRVVVAYGNGREGYPMRGPYTHIIYNVAAQPEDINIPVLLNQLEPGGNLLVPLKPRQASLMIKKRAHDLPDMTR